MRQDAGKRRTPPRRVTVKQSTADRVMARSRLRVLCVGLFFVLCFGSIGVRLVEIVHQRSPVPRLVTASAPGEETQVAVSAPENGPRRGDIVDRNGLLLATSLRTASLFIDPRELRQPDQAARQLETLLPGVNASQLHSRIKAAKSFVWVKRHLSPREQQAVNALGIPGLYFLPDERRVYPHGNLSAHVLGYVGVDGNGLAGVEKTLDARLLDPLRNRDPLALSLDLRMQHILHDTLRQGIEEFRAIGGMGVVMDVRSGEILAMASLPDFDPHQPARASDAARFNRVALGTYEMGSTFKSFTVALALDAGTVAMNGGYNATQPFKVASFTIDDTHPKRRWLSVPEIYAYSSNIGVARMALDVGAKRQREFLHKLGLMRPVEIELPERASPQVPAAWQDITAVTVSYGHGIAVTPLHVVRAIGALVNGGTLPKLTLLKGLPVREGERVLTEQTSQHMRRLMRMVVRHGTGSKADVPGYRVGGKTGTAEKVQAGGSYSQYAKLASFVATFPVDDPRYVVLVMVDEPRGTKATHGYATGGWIAAPLAGRIIERIGALEGIRPLMDAPGDDAERYWVSTEKKPVPPVAAAPAALPVKSYVQNAAY